MYAFDGDLNAARVIQVQRRPDFSLDMDAIERAVMVHRPKVLFLASPNNPDGSLVPLQQIERLLELPVLLVLDEAYIEFASPQASRLGQVPARSNLVVLRTFSKWAGLAGLRVGFGAFPSALMPHLWKIKQPYNVSVAASTAAILALRHQAELVTIGQAIIAERQRLSSALGKLAWLQPYPSQANFVLLRVLDRPAREVQRALADQGILVRYFDKPGLQDHLRISVGKPEHTDRLIQVLKAME
jgi:histidinol-phosphate aminotransferase